MKRKAVTTTAKAKLAAALRERKEAVERQAATADVLKVISTSPSDLEPVFEAILSRALDLCEGNVGILWRCDGGLLKFAAHKNGSPPGIAYLKEHPLEIGAYNPTPRAALERRVIQEVDVFVNPQYRPIIPKGVAPLGQKSSTQIAVPLLGKDQLLGVVTIWRLEKKAFSESQVKLLGTFADQAVIAIENVRLFNETKEALEQQIATAEILKVIASSPTDVQPVFNVIVESAVRLCGARFGRVYRYDGSTIHMVASHGLSASGLGEVQRIFPRPASDDTIAGKVIVSRQPYFMQDIERDASVPSLSRGMIEALGTRSQVTIPMLRAGESIGAITMGWAAPGAFNDRQVTLLRTFADQAVIAIENARLFNETTEALERQTATADVLKVISGSPTDTQPVFDRIAERAATLCGASFGVVTRFDGELVHMAAFHGAKPEADAVIRKVYPLKPGGANLATRVIRDRAPAQIPDVLADPEYTQKDAARKVGFRSTLGVPLLREGRVVGAILVARPEVGPFPQRQIELLQTFADQAVIAIENSRLFNETKEALEQQTATSEILKVISGSPTDVQPVFDAIVESAARLFGRSARIRLVEEDQLHLRASSGPAGSAMPAAPLPISRDSLAGRVVLERTTLQIDDTEAMGVLALNVARGYRAIAAAALVRDSNVLGVIAVTSLHPGALSDKHMALLQTFADQAVIAIENVRLFKELQTRNSDLTEALEQQTATAEILRAISGATADAQPVFETIARNALRLCDAVFSNVVRYDGELLHSAALQGDAEFRKTVLARYPMRPNPSQLSGRVIEEKKVLRIWDAQADERYDRDYAVRGGFRRMLAVPMMRDDAILGVIIVAWRDAGNTPDVQAELLRTFADQAVIAIENVRLFKELESRNKDLGESLEQQTATSEILKVISGSPTDVQPVFDAIARSAARLFAPCDVGIQMRDGDRIQLRAIVNHSAAGKDVQRMIAVYPIPYDVQRSVAARAMAECRIIDGQDTEAPGMPEFLTTVARAGKFRSFVVVPLVHQEVGIGAIALTHPEPGFKLDEKQLALLKTFAAQAVIAIENVRLFREIQEKSAQLQVANKHKSEFLANMSHELRTPLNAIIGFSEVLSERMFGELNEKQADYMKDIHESGRHLLSLINDILDLSKIEAGRMELEVSSFHLPTAISNAMTLVRERAQRHGVRLGTEIDPRLGELNADERKVKQILLNLLSNAVKFTPEGGRVDVSAKLDTDRVEIAVKDTGAGISAEDQARLFEEFRQVGKDSARKAEGTGLGLALTKKFVELHGGEIRVDSAPGKGSVFSFTLPLR